MKARALSEAVERIPDGASLMIGGFMGIGTPERLVDELVPKVSVRPVAVIRPGAIDESNAAGPVFRGRDLNSRSRQHCGDPGARDISTSTTGLKVLQT